MSSLKSRMIIFMMRNRHLLKFHMKREAWDEHTSIPRFREECEQGAKKAGKLPPGIDVTPLSVAGMPAEWICPVNASKDAVIFYTHGGGYVSGSCADHRHFVAKFVKGSGLPALLFEYRLAPEHPYPGAVEDSLAAYHWLLDSGVSPAHIVIVGESAGAGLGLALLLALRDKGLPLPAAAVALSPYTDLKLTGESLHTKAEVCLSPLNMSQVCSKLYAGESDPTLPWMSPLYGDLHGLPPIHITVGEDETLLDDSTRFAEKAKAAGVEITLRVAEGMVHCYPLFAPLFPEATQALEEICAFIKMHTGADLDEKSSAYLSAPLDAVNQQADPA